MRQIALLAGTKSLLKTYCAASIAHLASIDRPVALVDADLDDTNLTLFLTTHPGSSHPWHEGTFARIDHSKCKSCGACYDCCQFGAVTGGPPYNIISQACVGCETCVTSCPVDAIVMNPQTRGTWHRTETRFGPLFHGQLEPGQRNTGHMVTKLRQQAGQWAQHKRDAFIITDGPSGVLTPTLATVAGIDLAILIITPNLDVAVELDRLQNLLTQVRIRLAVILVGTDERLRATRERCSLDEIPIVGTVDSMDTVCTAMCSGRLETEHKSPMSSALHQIWQSVDTLLSQGTTHS